jgi:hypothetical protein
MFLGIPDPHTDPLDRAPRYGSEYPDPYSDPYQSVSRIHNTDSGYGYFEYAGKATILTVRIHIREITILVLIRVRSGSIINWSLGFGSRTRNFVIVDPDSYYLS